MQKAEFDVTMTNLEALRSKKSAVLKGYMKDEFINFFIPQNVKKEILLNRGYWLRYWCFRKLVESFIQNEKEDLQIVSLGCGLDTLPFYILKKYPKKNFNYFECDLEVVTKHKISFIENNKTLEEFLKASSKNLKINGSSLNSEKYNLFPCDLNYPKKIGEVLEKNGLKKNVPTLIISECVLAYLEKNTVPLLLENLKNYFTNFAIIDYEMYNPTDGFGKVMIRNFKNRGIPLSSIDFFYSLENIKENYIKKNYDIKIETVLDLYNTVICRDEIQRINKLEWIDEFEELFLMFRHYFISIAKFSEGEMSQGLKMLSFDNIA